MKKDDFYPCVLRFDPPIVVTRDDVDEYYRRRGTVVTMFTIPALAQGGPGDDSHRITIPEYHRRTTHR